MNDKEERERGVVVFPFTSKLVVGDIESNETEYMPRVHGFILRWICRYVDTIHLIYTVLIYQQFSYVFHIIYNRIPNYWYRGLYYIR